MKIKSALFAVVLCSIATPAFALWQFVDSGIWPKTWPAEMEPLRQQARSLEGGLINRRVYEIPFTSREQFESAWSHILKVKSEGAPVILLRGSKTRFFGKFDAGVVIWQPPRTSKPIPEKPLSGDRSNRQTWLYTTFIELVVDGNVVDLNRIPIPADTPIIDERFVNEEQAAKQPPSDEN